MKMASADVLIIGGGPAGLAAATELRALGIKKVLIAERDSMAGGIPRHSKHPGFGWKDMRRLHSGPKYASKRLGMALNSGVECQTETSVVSFTEKGGIYEVILAGPDGHTCVMLESMLLATGCRERTRPSRGIAGKRPSGIFTTSALQQLVYLKNIKPGRRAVVIGAEHVAFSAVLTLRAAGMKTAAVITSLKKHQSYGFVAWALASLGGIPLMTSHEITQISGSSRVEGITVRDLITGVQKDLECDTVVFTGEFIPEIETALSLKLSINNQTKGPAIDQGLRTSRRGIFAAGNILRGAETADISAMEGIHAARSISAYFKGHEWRRGIELEVTSPLKWVAPNRVVSGERPPLNHFTLRTGDFIDDASIQISQGGRLLYTRKVGSLIPNRPIYLDDCWTAGVHEDGEIVKIELMPKS